MGMSSKRNLARKAKKARHEQEKVVMENMRGMGCIVGEYAGDGKGEASDDGNRGESTTEELPVIDVDDVDDGAELEDDQSDDEGESSDDAKPLLFIYDCETTGFSVYDEHITDIAAKVVDPPLYLATLTYSSLVRTSRRIPKKGILLSFITVIIIIH